MTGLDLRRAIPTPIEPLRACAPDTYLDDVVAVYRRAGGAADAGLSAGSGFVTTQHFALRREGHRLALVHRLPRHRIDNDLVGLLAGELFGPGWISGVDTFERLLVGIVLSSVRDPAAAWSLFYRNTLRRLEILQCRPDHPAPGGAAQTGHGSLAGYAPVYRRALELAGHGDILELGSCFGFLSLQLAARGCSVTATDISPATVDLLGQIAAAHGADLRTAACDAARVPLPDRSQDAVLAVHLLEHLDAAHGLAVLAEATRLARRRVVVAVPYESEADPAYGHVRTFDHGTLLGLGAAIGEGWRYSVTDFHGGWLVLDRVESYRRCD